MTTRILAVVPARGGSKGVPRKNLRQVAGRSLVEWAIAAAREDAMHEPEVLVTSDSDEILSIAAACGARTLRRPADLATDTSSTDATLLHALDNTPWTPRLVVLLQPTSPLRPPGLVRDMVEAALRNQADCTFTVHRLHFVWWRNASGEWSTNSRLRPMRQDMTDCEVTYAENGAAFVFRPESVTEHGCRMYGRVQPYEIPREYGLDIDTEGDVLMAQHAARFMKMAGRDR